MWFLVDLILLAVLLTGWHTLRTRRRAQAARTGSTRCADAPAVEIYGVQPLEPAPGEAPEDHVFTDADRELLAANEPGENR